MNYKFDQFVILRASHTCIHEMEQRCIELFMNEPVFLFDFVLWVEYKFLILMKNITPIIVKNIIRKFYLII